MSKERAGALPYQRRIISEEIAHVSAHQAHNLELAAPQRTPAAANETPKETFFRVRDDLYRAQLWARTTGSVHEAVGNDRFRNEQSIQSLRQEFDRTQEAYARQLRYLSNMNTVTSAAKSGYYSKAEVSAARYLAARFRAGNFAEPEERQASAHETPRSALTRAQEIAARYTLWHDLGPGRILTGEDAIDAHAHASTVRLRAEAASRALTFSIQVGMEKRANAEAIKTNPAYKSLMSGKTLAVRTLGPTGRVSLIRLADKQSDNPLEVRIRVQTTGPDGKQRSQIETPTRQLLRDSFKRWDVLSADYAA